MKKPIIGVLLILAGLCIVLAAIGMPLGFIPSLGLSFTDVLFTVIAIIFLFNFIAEGKWSAIPFPIAFGFMFLEDNIAKWMGKENENLVSNWLVLLCTIMISIGIGMIESTKKEQKCTVSEAGCGDTGYIKTQFGSASRYVDCKNFSFFRYSVNMGDGTLYFENPESYISGGTLQVKCSMGNMKIYVPNGWQIKENIHTNLGNTVIPAANFPDGPVLNITGSNDLGNLEISYR